MKIAVLSDIHGNYVAFESCLEHALANGVTMFCFLGDYLGEFPYPQKTMEILEQMRRQYRCVFLRGNKEDYWINRKNDTNCEWKNGNHSVYNMKHNYECLTADQIDLFASFPISARLQFEGCAPVLLCHGAPQDNKRKLRPEDAGTNEAVDQCEERYIVCGHTHVQQVIREDEKVVLNAGAVGVPLHSTKAQYLILEPDGREWKYEFASVAYDRERVIRELHESGLWEKTPYWCRITANLLRMGAPAHGTVLHEVVRVNDHQDPWYNIGDSYWEEVLKAFGIE